MLTPTELKLLLAAHNLRLTKRLGQHHLIDTRFIERIVECCELSREETVVEIGAGLGALTEPLAKRAGRVIAIEVDRRISALLAQRMAPYPNVRVVCEDILTYAWDQHVSGTHPETLGRVARSGGPWPPAADDADSAARRGRTGSRSDRTRPEDVRMNSSPVVVVGAIPYSITSPIIVSLFEARPAIRRAVLILQEEVAQRLLAVPNTKAYGRLSVLAQYGWQMTSLLRIPRSAFFPPPNVDSSCLRFVPHPHPPVIVADEPRFFALVKAAFAHRRKSLVNCLSDARGASIDRPHLQMILRTLGLSATVRGEALSLAEFAALCEALGPEKR